MKGKLSNESPLVHFLVLLASIVVFFLLAQGVSVLLAPLFGFGLMEVAELTSKEELSTRELNLLKWMQIVAAIGSFVIPALVYAYLVSKKPYDHLGFKKKTNPVLLLLSVVSIFTIIGVIGYTFQLNQSVNLPASLQALEDMLRSFEESAERLTMAFIETDTIPGLLFNIFIVGIIPALGEELLFRGALQGSLERWLKNGHVAIFTSALVFSAIHMQFYGFLPRFILGLLLGYLFFWSRNLWVPIAVHFVNNTYQVIAYYFMKKHNPDFEMETPQIAPLLALGSLIATGLLLYAFYKLSKNQNQQLV